MQGLFCYNKLVMVYYNQSVESTLEDLKSTNKGISQREAAHRLKSHGLNVINVKGEPLWHKIIEPFANVFMLVLFIAALISVIQHTVIDAVIIIVIILVSAIVYYVQRFSTERILRSLKKHNAQKIEVIRGGESYIIEDTQLVPGDIVRLTEGDRVPADIRVIEVDSAQIDESVLTGESSAVTKSNATLSAKKEVYEQTNMMFQGSFMISGQASGVVTATGNHTEFGRIASLTKHSPENTQSPVQKKIDKLITLVIAVVAAVSVLVFALALIRGIEVGEALRFVMALAVSAVPESLPIAITVILVLGMRRMAAKKALVRTMRSIETIGVITTIATDKTGTLTENKLSVQETWQPDGSIMDLKEAALLSINSNDSRSRDPLDLAMSGFIDKQKLASSSGKLLVKLPFDQSVSMSGNIWQRKSDLILAVKGAPEQVLDRCKMNKSDKEQSEVALKQLTGQGYRVIALATTKLSKQISSLSELKSNANMDFDGFLAIADTLRPSAKRSILAAQNAGVSVRMITGDHFETAYHIGKQLGLVSDRSQVFDSRLMSDMTESQLKKEVYSAKVFSRVTPENKFRILRILKAKEITAMTGDGVNDVPALSSANVGLAMGSGSQIAKDAGDIILLNDNFSSIVRAMKEGRVIFSNIQKMVFYLLATNTGEIVVTLGAIIVGMPVPLAAVQILWVNLVTDTSMVIPIGLEPGEKDVMSQKPVNPKAPLLNKIILTRIVIVAISMGVIVLVMYAIFSNMHDNGYGRTIAFTSLVVVQWANAFNARSMYESIFSRLKVRSRVFYIGLAISVAVQWLAIFGPLQSILHVQPVSWIDLLVTSVITFILMIAIVELHKYIIRAQMRKSQKNPTE